MKVNKLYGLYYQKIVAVTFDNEDGTNRQDLINKLNPGDRLYFEQDVDNPNDDYAIAILNVFDEKVGYLAEQYSQEISIRIDEGFQYFVCVEEIVGEEYIGCVMKVCWRSPEADDSEFNKFIKENGISIGKMSEIGCNDGLSCGSLFLKVTFLFTIAWFFWDKLKQLFKFIYDWFSVLFKDF